MTTTTTAPATTTIAASTVIQNLGDGVAVETEVVVNRDPPECYENIKDGDNDISCFGSCFRSHTPDCPDTQCLCYECKAADSYQHISRMNTWCSDNCLHSTRSYCPKSHCQCFKKELIKEDGNTEDGNTEDGNTEDGNTEDGTGDPAADQGEPTRGDPIENDAAMEKGRDGAECEAIAAYSKFASLNEWCDANCLHDSSPYCPASHCRCWELVYGK